MTAYRFVELGCDLCTDSLDCTAPTVAEVREIAQGRGWRRVRRFDVCPDCIPAAGDAEVWRLRDLVDAEIAYSTTEANQAARALVERVRALAPRETY